jgi:hypothetical protein
VRSTRRQPVSCFKHNTQATLRTHVRVCAGVLLDCVQCSAVCNLMWCTSRVNQCVGRYCRYCSQVIHLSDSCFVLHKLCKVGCIQFTQGFVFGEIKIPTEEGGGYLRVLIFGWVPWSTAITWYHNRNNLVLLEISRTAPHWLFTLTSVQSTAGPTTHTNKHTTETQLLTTHSNKIHLPTGNHQYKLYKCCWYKYRQTFVCDCKRRLNMWQKSVNW